MKKDKKMANTSSAVMSQRTESKGSLDNFPTPPWATRALLEYVIGLSDCEYLSSSCLEPACGAGHMSKVLEKYFWKTVSSDIYPYGYGKVQDFTDHPYEENSFDWVITNPPFNLAESFILAAQRVARKGVAALVRTQYLESKGRYERLFSKNPPSVVAQFVERVPMVKGRLDKKASTATGYAWLFWDLRSGKTGTELIWIPPCRKELERQGDYVEVFSSSV